MLFQSPTNFKNARLIVGMYRVTDLIILSAFGILSLALVLTYILAIKGKNFIILILLIQPALLAALLTYQFPMYHNFFGWFLAMQRFFPRNKKYVWAGIDLFSINDLEEDYEQVNQKSKKRI